MTTLNLQVAANSDDAFEKTSTGRMYLTDSLLYIGHTTLVASVGLRFQSVSGLAGSTIDSAVLTFRASTTDSTSFIADWYGQDAEAPGTFTSGDYNITTRTRTTATCEADGSDFGAWVAGQDHTFSGDGAHTIAEIIQELADSYDPSTIVLLCIYTSGSGKRQFPSYGYDSPHSAKLDIDHTAGSGTTTLTPDPVAVTVVVPAPTLVPGSLTVAVDAVSITVIVPSVTIKPTTITLTPDPVAVSVVVPTPTVLMATIMQPDPVVVTVVVPTPSVYFGPMTVIVDPVVISVMIPPVTIPDGGGVTWGFYGWEGILDPAWWPPGATFQLRAIISTTVVSVPVYARLLDLTTGYPIDGSEITSTNITPAVTGEGVETLSDEFSLPSGEHHYRVQFGGESGGEVHCEYAGVRPVSP